MTRLCLWVVGLVLVPTLGFGQQVIFRADVQPGIQGVQPPMPGKPLEILDGQLVEKVDFSLPRGGIVTGRVIDEFGEPLPDAMVSMQRYQNMGGQRRLVPAGRTSMTNDVGEFRLYAIPPGQYFLSATLRNPGM